MNLTTVAENLGRFFAVFGFVVVLSMMGVSIYKATLVNDVYAQQETFQGTTPTGAPSPATSTNPEVREDWQNAMTIKGWEGTARLLGLGSILTGIILFFAIVIYRGVKAMTRIMPYLWQGYLGGQTGEVKAVDARKEFDIELPFGGGT